MAARGQLKHDLASSQPLRASPLLVKNPDKALCSAERPPNIHVLRWTPEWSYWQVTRPPSGRGHWDHACEGDSGTMISSSLFASYITRGQKHRSLTERPKPAET